MPNDIQKLAQSVIRNKNFVNYQSVAPLSKHMKIKIINHQKSNPLAFNNFLKYSLFLDEEVLMNIRIMKINNE